MDFYTIFISSNFHNYEDFSTCMTRNVTGESLQELVKQAIHEPFLRGSSRDELVSYAKELVFLTPDCLMRLFHENKHFGSSVKYNIETLLEDWKFLGFVGYDMRVNSILAPGAPSGRLHGWGEWTFRNEWPSLVKRLWRWRDSLSSVVGGRDD